MKRARAVDREVPWESRRMSMAHWDVPLCAAEPEDTQHPQITGDKIYRR